MMKNRFINLSLLLFPIYIISLCLQTDLFKYNLSAISTSILGYISLWVGVIWFMVLVLHFINKPSLIILASILFNLVPYGYDILFKDLHVILVYFAFLIYTYVLLDDVVKLSYIDQRKFFNILKIIFISSGTILLLIGRYKVINGLCEIIYIISYLLILYIGHKK